MALAIELLVVVVLDLGLVRDAGVGVLAFKGGAEPAAVIALEAE